MKRHLFILLALVAFGTGAFAQNFYVWDGQSTSRPHKYSYNPYRLLIETPSHLAWIREHWNESEGFIAQDFPYNDVKYCDIAYKLTNNIDMGEWSWTPLGNDDGSITDFNGSFFGEGHTIRINVSGNSDNCQGLFARIGENGQVYDLHVTGDIACGNARQVGGIAGHNDGLIYNCWVSANVSSTYLGGWYNANVGGIVGENDDGEIHHCCMSGHVTNNDADVGGIAGGNDGVIDHVSFLGLVHTTHSQDNIFVGDSDGSLTNCHDSFTDDELNNYINDYCEGYSTYSNGLQHPFEITIVNQGFGSVTSDAGLGARLGQLVTITKASGQSTVNTLTVTAYDGENIPVSSLGNDVFTFTMPQKKVTVTAVFNLPDWYNHAGTEDDPYLIGSPVDWNEFVSVVNGGNNFEGKFLKQTADLSGLTTAVGNYYRTFQGTYDGDGHLLNFNLGNLEDDPIKGLAPFRNIKNATIKNLRTNGAIRTYQPYAAGLVGYADGTNLIEGCTVTTTIFVYDRSNHYVGGILGHGLSSHTTIRNCVFGGTIFLVTSWQGMYLYDVGVIWGYSNAGAYPVLENCIEKGEYVWVESMHPIGLFGNNGTVTDCFYFHDIDNNPALDNPCTVSGAYKGYNNPPDGIYKRLTVNGYTVYSGSCSFQYVDELYSLQTGVVSITPVVKDPVNRTLVFGTDFTVALDGDSISALPVNINASGTHTLTLTGIGQYGGSKTFDIPVLNGLQGEGTVLSPYLISSATDWYIFANTVNAGVRTYAGEYVRLDANVSATTMVGSSESHSFQGTFNGNNKTVTFTKGSSTNAFTEESCAPFRYVKNATIQDLNVTGDIYMSNKFAAGLVSRTYGTTNITGCQVSTVIHSSRNGDGTHGGFVALPSGTLNISNCVYNGRMFTTNGTTNCGGFVAWHNNATNNVSHSIYAPDPSILPAAGEVAINNGATFVRGVTPTLTHCYYTETVGTAQGLLVYTTSTTNNIVKPLLLFDGNTYYAPCTVTGVGSVYELSSQPSITLTVTDTYDNTSLSLGNDYTATLNNTTVSAFPINIDAKGDYTLTLTGTGGYTGSKSILFSVLGPIDGSGTPEAPYLINSNADWITFANNVNNGTKTYAGECVQLDTDVSATTMVGSSESHSFQGTFIGNNHTVTFTKGSSTSAFADQFCAPFRYVKNATIQDLNVTGDIYMSNKFAAGLVSRTYGTTNITGCQVSTVIHSSTDYSGGYHYGNHGGFVALQDGPLNISNCVYKGRLFTTNGTISCGGFVGYNNESVNVSHSIYDPDPNILPTTGEEAINDGATFVLYGTPTLTHCYYTQTLGNVQGKQVYATVPANEISKLQQLVEGHYYYLLCEVSGVDAFYPYTGEVISVIPAITAEDNTVLTPDVDYTYTFDSIPVLEPGDYTMTITATPNGNVAGTKNIPFSVGTITPVTSTTEVLTTGEYKVYYDLTVNSRITIDGDVVLNLKEGTTLTVPKGIELSQGNSLTINGPGALTIDNPLANKSGIGAYNVGTLTINGGVINAMGGSYAAGIGGDSYNPTGGYITINDGVVNATGGYGSAGIGGGVSNAAFSTGVCGYVTINGGKVTATGGEEAPGIGCGFDDNDHHINQSGYLTLGWTHPDDFVKINSLIIYWYHNGGWERHFALSDLYFDKCFVLEGANTIANQDNLAGHKIVPYAFPLYGAGTSEDPYIISNADEWNEFANLVNQGGFSFQNKFVQLTDDITVSTMVGTSEGSSFKGIFFSDGEHTLTFNQGTSDAPFNEEYCAPFRYVKNAIIRNLKVAGNIYISNKFAAGLVGHTYGTTNITECLVGTVIHSSTDINGNKDGTHGGIVAMPGGTLNIMGCTYHGRMLTTNGTLGCGGIVGWYNGATVNVSNSFYLPDPNIIPATGEVDINNGFTFVRYSGDGSSISLTNCYYTQTLGDAQGIQVYTTAPDNILTKQLLLADGNDYYVQCMVSGINSVYESALSSITPIVVDCFNTGLYHGTDYTATLNGTQVSEFPVNLTEEGDYTLILTGKGNCAGSTSLAFSVAWALQGSGTQESPYLINSVADWITLASIVASGINDYNDQFVKLTTDIEVSTMVGANSDRRFMGTFDGDGHTLTFNQGTADEPFTEECCAPFRYTSGCTIQHLKVAGNIYTSNKFATGLVSRTYGTTNITDCLVSTVIHSSTDIGGNLDGTHGGFVAMPLGTLNITGCTYHGRMLTTNGTHSCGGFVGWYNTATVVVSNSFYLPDTSIIPATGEDVINNGATFVRYSGNGSSIYINNNCYYTEAMGTVQGAKVYRIDGSTGVTVTNAGGVNYNYNVSELTYYTGGIQCMGGLYAVKNDLVNLNLSCPPAGSGYYVNAGTLSGSTNPYTLTMPGENVVINFKIAREIEGYDNSTGSDHWAFIASPVNGSIAPTEVGNLLGTQISDDPVLYNYDLYRLNPSTVRWENYHQHTADFNIVNGRGYLYATAENKTLVFQGTYNTGTEMVIDNLPQGYNLVGNPFTVDAYVDKSYYTLNGDGSIIVAEPVSVGTAIPPCYGVIVEVVEEESVTFSTSAPAQQNANNGGLQIAVSQVVEPVETPSRNGNGLKVGPSTGSGTEGSTTATLVDNAIVSFNEGTKLGKFYFGTQNANIYLPKDGKDYAIAYSKGQGEMPLNFKATKNGEYTLTVNPENMEMNYLHLIDNMTGADIDLLTTTSYTFESKTTDYESRFKLVFATNDENGSSTGSETFAFISNGNLIVSGTGTLQVIDATGRQLISKEVHSSLSLSTSNLTAGVYVLRLIGEDLKMQKIILK